MRIPNFYQITHLSTFGSKCELSLKSIADSQFFSNNSFTYVWKSFHTRKLKIVNISEKLFLLLSKNFVSPKMVAILNFRSFCKTQKCLYLENCARWSEFNKIFDLLDISAENPCQFSKYFCLAKYSGHFEFFAKIAKHNNAYILKTVLDRADCADFGCHNCYSIRLETEHFLNTLALAFISFTGRFVFAMQKHYLFFLRAIF